jgi:UDP-GlcNAc:undecaprenyl-phosphate GlcNAc-1-phosphate transferase
MIPPPPSKSAVAAFVLALIIAALLTPDLRQFAERHGLLDQPDDSRKIHRRGIPRIGGLAIAAAFYAPLIGLLLYETGLGELFYANRWAAFSLLGGGVAIAALGLYDDLRGLGAKEKFALEFAVAAVLYFCGYRIEQVSLPGGALELGAAAFPLTLIWIVGVINAMNLIDGLDGLAGGVALCAILTNLIVAVVRAEPIMILCMAALAGALIGFLFYNFNPASIFMGDSGSLFLGYVLAASSIRTNQKASAAVSLLVPMVALAVPITDTALAMARRMLAGRSMFRGDGEHIHHRLLRLGLSQRQAVLVLFGTSCLLGGAALTLAFATDRSVAWVLVVVSGCGFLALRRLGFFHAERGLRGLRLRNHALRTAVNAVAGRLRAAASVADVLESTKTFAPAVSADALRLELAPAQVNLGSDLNAVWMSPGLAAYNGHARDVPGLLRARFDLPDQLGNLELEWIDGRGEIDRDHALAAEALCMNIASAVRRIAQRKLQRRSVAPRSKE